MRPTLILLEKEFRLFLKDWTAISLTFLVPAVLIYIFGHVFGINRSESGPIGIPIAIVDQVQSNTSAAIIAALEKEKSFRVVRKASDANGSEHSLTEPEVRRMLIDGDPRFALIFPEEKSGSFGIHVRFLNNPRNEIETETVKGLVQKTVFSSAPEAIIQSLQERGKQFVGSAAFANFNHELAASIAQTFGGDPAEIEKQIQAGDFGLSRLASNESGDGSGFLDQLVKIDSEQIGVRQVKSPQATRSVGGWAMMFLLFALSAAATSLFEEKKAGMYQRLLAAPVGPTHILWSKYLFGVILGLVQLLALFTAGHFLYGIEIMSNFGNLLLVCLAASFACVAFGMLLAAIAPTPAAASGLGTFLILTMSAIGGAWFPTSFMPEFIQHLSRLTIVYWAMDGFLRVLYGGAGTRAILPGVAILFGISALVTAVSVWRFQRGRMFD
jgi:ABC-2 type transport system permease protein